MSASDPSRHGAEAVNHRTNVASTHSDRTVVYAEYGDPDGTPVVFLHGTPGSHRLGALLDSAGDGRGVRVLAPSRPGYSRSSPWPERSLSDAAAVVRAVLDDAGVRAAGLIGFSGGCPHALATAATHPDRVTRADLVSGAVPPEVSAETPALQRLLGGLATRMPALLGGLFRGQAWAAARLDPAVVVGLYTAGESGVPEATAQVVRADFREAFVRHRSGAVTDLRNTSTEWGIDYGAIAPAVRVWHGGTDTNVPVGDARRFARELPTAELRLLPDADHLRTLLRATPALLDAHC
jgi:pimeloyl-ACP methyl ester carboxylesterase